MNRPSSEQNLLRRWLSARPLSFRARLVVTNLLIVLVAVIGMGYYVYYRAQASNSYLTNQLEQSVQAKAEEQLSTAVNRHAEQLSSFFINKNRDVTLFGSTVHNLLLNEKALKSGFYWDAWEALSALPNGSWDNANSENAAIFVPATAELTPAMVSELNTVIHADTIVPNLLEASPEIIAIYFGGTYKETVYYPNIDLANIVPPDFDVTQRPWFVAASPQQNPGKGVVWSDPYQDAALHGLVVTSSIPVFDGSESFRGVAAMDIQLNIITEVVSQIKVGDTGYAFLVDRENRLIAFPDAAYKDFSTYPGAIPLGDPFAREKLPHIPDDFFAILSKVAAGESGLTTITIGGVERFMVYRPVAEADYGLAIIVPAFQMLTEAQAAREQLAEETRSTINLSLFIVGFILLIASAAAIIVGNTLTAPLKTLTSTADEITRGNMEARAEVTGKDEIGILGQALNTMTSTLSSLIQSLEQRVAERTADLETARLSSEERMRELEIIAKISAIVAREQKIENLLPLITVLVSEQFDFYHVGVFLLDSTKQFAILQAANSEGGQRMLARGHRLQVGEIGIVGYVTRYGEPRIALDVGTDAVFFSNPDLPSTRSEMTLPLISHGEIIGALDVQSNKPGAFTERDAQTLGILADQISTAIENARLFEQTQQALREAQAMYMQFTQEGWKVFADEETQIGYRQSMARGSRLNVPIESDEIRQAMNRGSVQIFHADGEMEEPEIVVPVKLRGQVIGAIKIKAPTRDRSWSQDEIGLAEAISERLSLALENARLIQDSQRQAIKEQAISEVTSKIGSSINLRSVLQTAVEELGRSIPGSEVVIRFKPENGRDK